MKCRCSRSWSKNSAAALPIDRKSWTFAPVKQHVASRLMLRRIFQQAPRRWLLCLFLAFLSVGVLAALTACTGNQPPSDEQIKTQAAQATEAAKEQSKEVLHDAKAAAANAERQVDAIAAGVKQGIKSSPASRGPVDLNCASVLDLAALPGISVVKARQIQQHRPYSSAHQLVTRGVLREDQYEKIAADVTAAGK